MYSLFMKNECFRNIVVFLFCCILCTPIYYFIFKYLSNATGTNKPSNSFLCFITSLFGFAIALVLSIIVDCIISKIIERKLYNDNKKIAIPMCEIK